MQASISNQAPIAGAPVWSPQQRAIAPASLGLRMLAYVVDLVAIGALSAVAIAVLFVLGFMNFGLSWLLIIPAWMAMPALYSGLTLSSAGQATLGMRLFGIHLEAVDGERIGFLRGAAHALLFYVFATMLTPFILLVGLFTPDHSLLHDIVLRVRLVAGWGR